MQITDLVCRPRPDRVAPAHEVVRVEDEHVVGGVVSVRVPPWSSNQQFQLLLWLKTPSSMTLIRWSPLKSPVLCARPMSVVRLPSPVPVLVPKCGSTAK